jgi:fatty acid desaturase
VPIAVLGCLFAHAVELQHQCLHYVGYRTKTANRVVGFLLGIPMLVSFKDYQASHMFHHRMLGQPENREFFEYDHESLKSLGGMLSYLFMLPHYRQKTITIFKAMTTRQKSEDPVNRMIKTEYALIGLVFVAACVASAVARTPAILTMWVLPFLVALPVHVLIELPEHTGCEITSTDIFRNTRTIRAGWFGSWFTNGNNYHVEHHYLPSASIERLGDLHQALQPQIVHLEDSYWAFYKRVFRGSLHASGERQ